MPNKVTVDYDESKPAIGKVLDVIRDGGHANHGAGNCTGMGGRPPVSWRQQWPNRRLGS